MKIKGYKKGNKRKFNLKKFVRFTLITSALSIFAISMCNRIVMPKIEKDVIVHKNNSENKQPEGTKLVLEVKEEAVEKYSEVQEEKQIILGYITGHQWNDDKILEMVKNEIMPANMVNHVVINNELSITDGGKLCEIGGKKVPHETVKHLEENHIETYIMATNFIKDVGVFHKEPSKVVENMLNNQEQYIHDLTKYAKESKVTGIMIDFEGLNNELEEKMTAFMKKLSTECKKSDLKLGISVQPRMMNSNQNKAINYREVASVVDIFALMCYADSPHNPGPVMPWETLKSIYEYAKQNISQKDMSKVVMGMAAYGYSYNENGKRGKTPTLKEIEQMLAEKNVKIIMDESERAPYAIIKTEEGNIRYDFENTESIKAKLELLDEYGFDKNLALWQLNGVKRKHLEEIKKGMTLDKKLISFNSEYSKKLEKGRQMGMTAKKLLIDQRKGINRC